MHTAPSPATSTLPRSTLYAFWIFFAGLIFYLRREDKREGYPLESDRSGRITVEGFPPMPTPKIFRLPHGGTVLAPRVEGAADDHGTAGGTWPGAPLVPTGNPMLDGVGPAAWAARADTPDVTFDEHAAPDRAAARRPGILPGHRGPRSARHDGLRRRPAAGRHGGRRLGRPLRNDRPLPGGCGRQPRRIARTVLLPMTMLKIDAEIAPDQRARDHRRAVRRRCPRSRIPTRSPCSRKTGSWPISAAARSTPPPSRTEPLL